jgi:hypothetical protein
MSYFGPDNDRASHVETASKTLQKNPEDVALSGPKLHVVGLVSIKWLKPCFQTPVIARGPRWRAGVTTFGELARDCGM